MKAIVQDLWRLLAMLLASWMGLMALDLRAQDSESLEKPWTQELWEGVEGFVLNDLIGDAKYYEPADQINAVTHETTNREWFYGSRVRGLLTIPQDGDYTFWISTTEQGALYLSRDGTKWNRERIATVPKRAKKGDFDAYAEQQSQAISLNGGDQVFVEMLSKGAKLGGHTGLMWSYESGQVNWAQEEGVSARQSSTELDRSANRAIDGNSSGFFADRSVAMTLDEMGGWWEVDLGAERPVDALVLWSLEGTRKRHLSNFKIVAFGNDNQIVWSQKYFEEKGHVESRLRVELSEEMEEVPLVRRIRIVSLGENRQGSYFLSLAELEVLGPQPIEGSVYQPRVAIPSIYLAEYSGELNDLDGDELRDEWESQYGFSEGAIDQGDRSGGGDPDFDGWTNAEESRLESDPFSRDSFAGSLSLERWRGFRYDEAGQAVLDPRFFGAPDEVGHVQYAATGVVFGQNQLTRLRGYLEAPVTGEYRFWVTGKEGVEFYLSSVPGSKYHKQRLAHLSETDGTGLGIGLMSEHRWDVYSTQLSEPVYLEAGERYYLEALQQRGAHGVWGSVGVAWAYSGQDREVIPSEHLYSYHRTADDLDDDYLPDDWELENGLDPQDNGAGNVAMQGERGDLDGDGLSNRWEYVLGTSANESDSDGDGLSDYDEVTSYGTDPTVSNELTENVVGTIDLADHVASANWSAFNGGWIADNFRGDISWDFEVPEDGWWVIEVNARLRGILRAEEWMPVEFMVNGSSLGPQKLHFRRAEPNKSRLVTPYLTAGSHRLTLKINNYVGRRKLHLLGIRVIQTGGLDVNENGIADWLENEAERGNGMIEPAASSLISPAFIEGDTRYSNQVAVLANGEGVVVESALGPQHWYANVPLQEVGETAIDVSFEQGQLPRQTEITWVAWNPLTDSPPKLRQGDSLKLALEDGGVVRIRSTGLRRAVYRFEPGDEKVHRFPKAGRYNCVVIPNGGRKRIVRLFAHDATLETLPGAFVSDAAASVVFPGVSPELYLSSGPSLEVLLQDKDGENDQLRTRLLARETGSLPVAVRLDENGPIVESGVLNAINYSDSVRNEAARFVGETLDGYNVLSTPLVITGMPPGGYAELVIYKAGVLFTDGTRTKMVTEDDLNDGVLRVEFLYPEGMRGGYCHHIVFYDANGNRIGSR